MPLDICVPYWGDPATFIATIDSVRAQSDARWRLTIIDDCYPGTEVRDHVEALHDPRISYRRNEVNVGITENFRRAVNAAEGPHVVVLGSDDLLLPDYVAHVRESLASHPDVDVLQPGVQVIDSAGQPRRTLVDTVKQALLTPAPGTTLRGEDMARSLLRGNWLYWPSLVLRTETVRRIGFRDGLPIILDLALLTDIAFEGGALHYSGVTCFAYRRHAASLSQTSLKDGTRFDDERRFYLDCAERASRMRWKRAERAARERIMSRFHAVTHLPSALTSGDAAARQATWRLAFGR